MRRFEPSLSVLGTGKDGLSHPCSDKALWIPAFAGMTVRSDNRIGVDGIIPAFAGMTVITNAAASRR